MPEGIQIISKPEMRIKAAGYIRSFGTASAALGASDVPTVPCHAHFQASDRRTLFAPAFYVFLPPCHPAGRTHKMKNHDNPQQAPEYTIYIPRTKQRIQVTKEVYDAYYRPIWRTFKNAHRHMQCSCAGDKWWLCGGDCGECRFSTCGGNLSLDYEQEILGDIRPDDMDLESIVTDRIIFEQLLKRLEELLPGAHRIGELRLDGYSDTAIADILGIPRTTLLSRIKKAKDQIREEYGDMF
jgi:DNA-directed RNA polymerase specialized sigma24 family protein